MEGNGGMTTHSGLLVFRKSWHRRRRLRSLAKDFRNGAIWARRFALPRRPRPKKRHPDVQRNRPLIEPLHLPEALRNRIVELLAHALVNDMRAFPTMPDATQA